MASRKQRAQIAAETVAIAKAGSYVAPSGRKVVVGDTISESLAATALISPSDLASLRTTAAPKLAALSHETEFKVANETTFVAAGRLGTLTGWDRVCALNFASAKNPGGGFLSGAQAQEECLARASALHACLERRMEYYEANRSCESLLYTDHMIVAPHVPVIRDDQDRLLEEPWAATILTAPAPNAGAIAKNQPALLGQVEATFRRRIEMVLSAAVAFDQSAIVLGAWGCGVFGNDPAMVAGLFAEFLLGDGTFAKAFSHVAFAVLDRQGETIAPFLQAFEDEP